MCNSLGHVHLQVWAMYTYAFLCVLGSGHQLRVGGELQNFYSHPEGWLQSCGVLHMQVLEVLTISEGGTAQKDFHPLTPF